MNPLTDKRKHYEHIGRKVLQQALHGTSPIKKDKDLHKSKSMKEDRYAIPIRGRKSADVDVFTKKTDEMCHKKGGYIEKGEHKERVRERAKKHPHKRVEDHAEADHMGHHFHDGHHVHHHHHHHYRAGGPAKKWIQGAVSHPGALRKELHVKKGHDIPAGKLEKATNSSDPLLRKRAILAETLRNFHEK